MELWDNPIGTDGFEFVEYTGPDIAADPLNLHTAIHGVDFTDADRFCLGGEQLVARRLGSTQLVACASPAYLAGRGALQTPADLAGHSALTYAYVASPFVWRLADAEGRQHEVRVGGSLHANSGELLVAAAVAGMGIVFEPDFVVGPYLARGELRRVLPKYSGPKLDVWAVYPSRRHLSAKVRTFVDYLAEIFAADPLRPRLPAGNAAGARPKVEPAR